MGYLVKTNDDFRKYAPASASFDVENIGGSQLKAMVDIRDVVSKAVYDLAVSFYESAEYTAPVTDRDKLLVQLVDLMQGPFVNLTLYHRFIWLVLNINGSSVTVIKSDNEQVANKGQMIEAKEDLLETAWVMMAELVDFLNANADGITDDQDATVWKASEQYTDMQDELFKNYREFDKAFGIERSAVFFIRSRTIRHDVVEEELEPHLNSTVSEILAANPQDTKLIKLMKKFLAYRTMGRACLTFPLTCLPANIRQDYDKTIYTGGSKEDDTVRNRISGGFNNMAEKYLRDIDFYLNTTRTLDTANGETITTRFDKRIDPDDKYVSMV